MSAIPRNRVLSETVAGPLRKVAGRRWWLLTGTGVLQSLIVCLTVWLAAALIAGSLPDLPAIARIALSILAWGSLIACIIVFVKPILVRRSLSTVARDIESQLGDSRELLSSAVEFSGETDRRYAGSDELVAHVIRQAEEAARAVHPGAIVPLKSLSRWAMCLFPVLLCWAVLMPAMPTPMMRGLYALIAPWKSQLPLGLAAVRVTPGDITLAEGDPLAISAEVGPRLRAKPTVASATLVIQFPSGQTQNQEMTRTAARAFKTEMDRVLADFKYRIVTDDGSSPWHTVKVMPRPALVGVDVRYTFPAYTKLPPKSDPRKDGSIDALVGSEAQITLHATQPLGPKSRLIIGEKTAAERSIPLTSSGNNDYAATLTVANSVPYRIELVNAENLLGRDDLVRSIVARPDQPPIVAITAPAAKLLVPPDDTVPVLFKASDDFGVAKLEALVQIDGQSLETFDVPFTARTNKFTGRWNLVLPYQLAKRKLHDANRIEYQLRVTDNREPNPQVGFSAKQVIEIDHSFKQTLAAKTEAESAKNMIEAIKQAIDELTEEKSWLEPLARKSADRVFSAAMKKTAAGTVDCIVQSGADLTTVADANLNGPFADIAQLTKNIAAGSIRQAGEETAAAILKADQPAVRQKSLSTSITKLDRAVVELKALLEQMKFEAKQQEVARALEDMARHEREIARDLAKPQKDQDRNQDAQRQQALRQRLDELLNQNKELNSQTAREAAQKNQQLIQKIEQLEEQQKKLEGLAEKQEAVKAAQEPVNQLAEQQKELNKQIADFAKKEQPELKDANAQTPVQQKLDNIVAALKEPNRAAEGNQQQRESANELKQAARQLANAAKSNDAPPAQHQRQDKQDVQRAQAAEKKAQEIAKQVEAAKTAKDPNQANEQIKQKEQQLAQDLEQQANEMKGRDPAQKPAIEAAQKEIAEAKQAAAEGKAEKAEQQLVDAAEKLQGAAEADATAAQAEQKEMAEAAGKADELAQKQKDLADQTAKAAQALAKAREKQGDPQQLERGEQQAAQQAEQVANEAGQVQQQDQQQGNPAMAERAADAQKALKEAAKHEQAAAKASKENQPKQAAAEQKAAGQSLAQAEQAARGQPEQGEMAETDPAAAAEAAAEAAEKAAAGEKGDAAEKGEAAEKGDPTDQAAALPGDPAADPTGEHSGKSSASQKSSANHPAQTPQQLAQQAAASAQEARQAQDQALSGNAKAARQAARALNKAAAALDAAAQQQADQMATANPASHEPNAADPSQAQASNHQPGHEPGAPRPGNEPGNESGNHQSSHPGQTTNPQGINAAAMAPVDGRPDSVKEVGISASDWAKLPPLVQQQLLNAAQQSGPPGYQEMIKNYFVKIAKIKAEGGDDGK